MKTGKCTGCKKDIGWIEYLGKPHPVDLQRKRGFLPIEDEYGTVISWEQATIYESHFATCPKADSFRKKPKAPAEKPKSADDKQPATESTA